MISNSWFTSLIRSEYIKYVDKLNIIISSTYTLFNRNYKNNNGANQPITMRNNRKRNKYFLKKNKRYFLWTTDKKLKVSHS